MNLRNREEFINDVFEKCNGNNGGAISVNTNIAELILQRCVFFYCAATNKGGAIYSDSQIDKVTSSSCRYTFCSSKDGSIFFINNSNRFELNNNLYYHSASTERPSIYNGMFINGTEIEASHQNFTSCSSLRGTAALNAEISTKAEISYVTFDFCQGINIMRLSGIPQSAQIRNLIFYHNLAGENGFLYINGNWIIQNSVFIFNSAPNIIVNLGHLVLTKCLMDFDYFFSEYITFDSCTYSVINPQQIYQTFTLNVATEYDGTPGYINDTSDLALNYFVPERTKSISLNFTGILVIVCAALIIVLLIVLIVTAKLLKRHKKHVNHLLHEAYAQHQMSDNSSKLSNEYNESSSSNMYDFTNVPVPDTHIWDTDDGDMNPPKESPFYPGFRINNQQIRT